MKKHALDSFCSCYWFLWAAWALASMSPAVLSHLTACVAAPSVLVKICLSWRSACGLIVGRVVRSRLSSLAAGGADVSQRGAPAGNSFRLRQSLLEEPDADRRSVRILMSAQTRPSQRNRARLTAASWRNEYEASRALPCVLLRGLPRTRTTSLMSSLSRLGAVTTQP